jgi:hypothetical protein
VVVGLPSLVVAEATDIGLHTTLLLYLNSHDFDLVVSQPDFHFEHIGHLELISLNRIEVVFLLAIAWRHHLNTTWDVHLVAILLPVTTIIMN